MKLFSKASSGFMVLLLLLVNVASLSAQGTIKKDGVVINTVTTAVPFLRINPDARAGGMGDVGIASPADANAVYVNPAKLAFIDSSDFGFAVGFSPWLKALVNDIYLANLVGYYKVKQMQTIALSVRYFSLGNITFTDANGAETGQFRPNEFAIDLHYARRLGKYFSIAASLRYIYSNLAGGQQVDGNVVKAGMAGAGDISWFFRKNFKKDGAKMSHDLYVGMAITNIGSKISYTSNVVKDFIPTNLGIGLGYTLNLDKKNGIGFYTDFNKLMVPTPDSADKNGNKIYDFREKSAVSGMFTSFGDAPGGAAEEFREITVGVGAEYLYNKQFGVRFGYFYEPRSKGNRQFLTAGLTVKYSVVGLNFSYLIPTTIQRNPLDNTLRFSLLFDFKNGGMKGQPNGISLVDDTPRPKKEKKVKSAEPTPVEKKTEEPVQRNLEPVEPK